MPFRTVVQDMVDIFSPPSLTIHGEGQPRSQRRFHSLPSRPYSTYSPIEYLPNVWQMEHGSRSVYKNQDATSSVVSSSTYYTASSSLSSLRSRCRSSSDLHRASSTSMAVSTTQSRLRLVQNAVSTDLSPIVEGARAAWDQVIDRVSDASNQSDNLTMSCVSVASASVPTPAESKSGLEKITLAVETTTSSGTSAITHVSSSSTLVESSRMTSTDMFQRLLEHGCDDLTSRIDPGKYSSCRVAQGGFGDIWQGQLQDGMHVAVKVLRFALIDSGSKALKRMMREVYAWSKLDHENIHKLLGVTTHQGQLGMVSEWMTNGNLRDYLGRNPSVDRYKLCIQIAGAVRYIHDRDMANILVSLDGVIKLTDFDYSLIPDCSLYFTDTTRVGCGTLRWMAPELVLQGNCQRNKQTDVYALGMTFLEAMTGAPPYYPQCQLDPQVVAKLVQKILPERPTEHFAFNMRGNETWKLLTRCWDHNPALRPTAEAALTLMSSCSRLGEESDG